MTSRRSCRDRTRNSVVIEEPHRPLGGFPREVSARHVAGIESCLAQGRGGLASYMEAVDTKGDDWLSLRKLSDPFVNALRISPHGSLHDVLRLAAVMPW